MISLCSILISCGRRESPIQLPDADQVVIIQINLIKTDADKWGRKRIAKMIENLEAAVPLDRDAAEALKEDMILYQYARFAGCGLSEDEMDQILEERINLYENAENYKEIEKDFEAAGITLREYYTKLKYYFRIQDTKQHLYSLKCEEFMYTDRIGDKVSKNITEYWNTFLNDVVYPDMQGYDFSDFMKQLDMAEGFYRERH